MEQPVDELTNAVPAAQLEHCDRPAVSVNCSGGHGRQAVLDNEAPVVRYDPARQGPVKVVQFTAGLLEYVPGAHGAQRDSAEIQRVPRVHNVQDAEPAAANEFCAHFEHDDASLPLYVLIGQIVQELVPPTAKVPASQALHDWPFSPIVPAAHCLQTDVSK